MCNWKLGTSLGSWVQDPGGACVCMSYQSTKELWDSYVLCHCLGVRIGSESCGKNVLGPE